jgi:class 3 adenylate cyclase
MATQALVARALLPATEVDDANVSVAMPLRRFFPPHPCLDRLQHLIAERMLPGADKDRIDALLWAEFGDTCTIMFTDLAGFSRHVQAFGIIHFLQVIHEAARLHVPCIDRYGGRLLKAEGDSMLVRFDHPDAALDAALAMQAASAAFNTHAAAEDAVLLCIGLGHGRVLRIGDVDVYGAEVNAASKLGEDMANAGDILATDAFRASLSDARQGAFSPWPAIPPGATGAWVYRSL